MRMIAIAVVEMVAVATGYALAGVVVAAVIAGTLMVVSLRRAQVLKPPAEEQALRADAEALSARMERFAKVSQDQAREAKALARDILEGK